MPVYTLPNLAPFIDGGPPLDRTGLTRRLLPAEFEEKVFTALEYAMTYQRLAPEERQHRRVRTEAWLEELRWGDRYEQWHDRANRMHARAQASLQESDPDFLTKKKEADDRAEQLLRSALDPEQLKELDRRGYFHVCVGERRFRITRGRSHNIKEVDARGRIRRTLCAHPVLRVPDADTMLSQKLMLEAGPEVSDEFFRLANVMRHRARARRPLTETEREAFRREAGENLRIAQELRRQNAERAVQEALDASTLHTPERAA